MGIVLNQDWTLDSRLWTLRYTYDRNIFENLRRQYWQNGVQKRGQLANVYLHCIANCVKLMQPAFLPFLLVIPSDPHLHLQAAQRQHIAKELQIS